MAPTDPSERASRRAALAAALSESSYEALLVTSGENVRYLSGFTGSNGGLLVDRSGQCVLATDGRYVTQASAEAGELECIEVRAVGPALVERAAADGVSRLGFDARAVTVEALRALEAAGGDRVALVAADRHVEALRAVKDAGEVDALRRACAITDAAYADLLTALRPEVTERDVAWALTGAMRRHGADGPAFEIIAAFGENSAVPHHQPTDRRLTRGDLVKLDFGAKVDGYHADMTRTLVFGTAAGWQREIYDEVAALQTKLRDAAVVGALPADLDATMRTHLTDAGHEVAHGLGHGVGLAIHEDPFLTEQSPAPALVPGEVITIEPGIYLPGQGGVRIEDTVLISSDGPIALTTSDRALLQIS